MSLPLLPVPDTPVVKTKLYDTSTPTTATTSSCSTPTSLMLSTTGLRLQPPKLTMKTSRRRKSEDSLPLVSKDEDANIISKPSSSSTSQQEQQRRKKRAFLLSTAPLVPDASLEELEVSSSSGSGRDSRSKPTLPACRLRMRPTKKIARTPIMPYAKSELLPPTLNLPSRKEETAATTTSSSLRTPLQFDPCTLPACLMFPDIPATTPDMIYGSSTSNRPRFSLKPKPLKKARAVPAAPAVTVTNAGMLLAA